MDFSLPSVNGDSLTTESTCGREKGLVIPCLVDEIGSDSCQERDIMKPVVSVTHCRLGT